MKRPLITKITNNSGATLEFDTLSDHLKVYVGPHSVLKYPGDIFTVIPEKNLNAALKTPAHKFTIEYCVWSKEGKYIPVWKPLEMTAAAVETPVEVVKESPTQPVSAPKSDPDVPVDAPVQQTIQEVPAVQDEPESVKEAVTEEASPINDFFTNMEEEPKKTIRKRKISK